MIRGIQNLDHAFLDISLHDCTITDIQFLADGIAFQFDRALERQSEKYVYVPNVKVLMRGVVPDDITCTVVRLVRFAHRYCHLCTPYEFTKVVTHMVPKHPLKLIDEFYAYNQVFWRLAILPYRGGGKTKELQMNVASNGAIAIEYGTD